MATGGTPKLPGSTTSSIGCPSAASKPSGKQITAVSAKNKAISLWNALNVIVKLANEGGIPVIACPPVHAEQGALIGLGADYVEVGHAEGQLAADMLSGHDPATVPIINLTPNKLALNLSMLPRLQEKWMFPPEILESAAIVINEKGQRTEKARKPPASPQPVAALPKKWPIRLVEPVSAPSIDETELPT
jgi:hypothetical protein